MWKWWLQFCIRHFRFNKNNNSIRIDTSEEKPQADTEDIICKNNANTVAGKNNSINRDYSKLENVKFQIQGNNNSVLMSASNYKNIDLTILGNSNKVHIDKYSSISNVKIFMRGNHHQLIIGQSIIEAGIFWYEDNNCKIIIGKGTTINNAGLVVMEDNTEIVIGKDCMLSHDVTIRTSDSHSIIDLSSGNRINPPQNVSIGNHVWVCAYSSILKGSSIGDCSIIGIHSIVNSDIPNNSLAVGNPAKVIKTNVTWDREKLQVKS